MTQRSLLAVIIRGVGLWYVIGFLGAVSAWLAPSAHDDAFPPSYFWWFILTQLVAAVICLLFADRIASWLYRKPETTSAPTSVPAPDLWRFACNLAGLYALLSAVRALVVFLVYAFQGETSSVSTFRVAGAEVPLHPLVECVAFALFGAVLLAPPSRIGRWFRRTFSGTPTKDVEPRGTS